MPEHPELNSALKKLENAKTRAQAKKARTGLISAAARVAMKEYRDVMNNMPTTPGSNTKPKEQEGGTRRRRRSTRRRRGTRRH